MTFKDLNLRKIHKVELLKRLFDNKIETPTAKEKREIHKIIESSINNGSYLQTLNSLIVSIYFDNENTFNEIRRKGMFRYSKFVGKKCIVENIINDLLDTNKVYNLIDPENLDYLNSILNLSNLHKSYNDIHKYIFIEFDNFHKNFEGKSLIKSLLSYVDYMFLIDYYPKTVTNLMQISSRNKEDVCSAVSYLIYLLSTKSTFTVTDTIYISEEFIKSKEIENIIISACFISDFKEFEILIDHFNYRCIKVDANLKIIPPYEDFEKSIRIGFIREQLQYYNDLSKAEEDHAGHNLVSFEILVEEIYKLENFSLFKYTETYNYPRYVIEIPEPLYDIIIDKLFKNDLLFKEEILYLSKIFKEQLLTPENLKTIKIQGNLSLFEFIKIRRIFSFLFLMFRNQIFKEENKDFEVVLRSLIPVYPEDLLYRFIEKLTTTENVNSFLDLTYWEPGIDILFDLQYYPIIYIEKYYMIPLTILANSNAIRNLYASQYKENNLKILLDGSKDALIDKLSDAFHAAGIENYKQTSVPKTDIDLFAILDDTLFLFECKQSLHPVSIFDLRTTFDYIKKAEKQLDYLNSEFHSGRLTKILAKKFKIDFTIIKHVSSIIILSNRLFNGNAFKYPIRYISEIENYVTEGTLRTKEGVFSMWEGDNLTLSDLKEYLSLNSKHVKLFLDSVSVRTLTYNLTDPPILFDAYYLSAENAEPKLHDFTLQLKRKEDY
jgi:hypothetical protein